MAELEVHLLIGEHVGRNDTLVYADSSVHHREKSDRGFSATVRGIVIAEKNEARRPTTSV